MQLCRNFCLLIFILLWVQTASAQQLSYPGGQTLVLQNNGSQHSVEFNHSLRYNVSIGAVVQYNDNSDDVFIGQQVTWLIKRINGNSSQTNFVVSGGVGNLINNGDNSLAGFTQLALDHINTKNFIAYTGRATFANGRDNQYRQTMRGGIALHGPREGKVQPFLALQLDRFDGIRSDWRASPFIRLVKGAMVGEIGVNDEGGILANLVILL